jgi:predicted PurR-regulated permease PerM
VTRTGYASSPSRRPSRLAWAVLLVALVVSLLVVLKILAAFVAVIFVALVAAGLLYEPFRTLAAALNGRRRLAAVLICLALVLALLVPLAIIAIEVSQEAFGFYEFSTDQLNERTLLQAIEANQEAIDRVNNLLAPFGFSITPDEIAERLITAAAGVGRFFYKQGGSLATGLVRFVIGFLVWVITLYYLFVDGRTVRRWFREFIPLSADEQDLLRNRFMDMAESLVVGNGIAAIIQGIAGGILFSLLDLQGPVLWGVVMGILAFIPVVGISLVSVPAWAILMLAGDPERAFALLIPLMVLATLVEYWLKPVLVGRHAHLHTLLVFFSLLGGFDAFGPVGLLIGPLMMVAFLTLVDIYRDHYRPYLASEPAPVTAPATSAPEHTASPPTQAGADRTGSRAELTADKG